VDLDDSSHVVHPTLMMSRGRGRQSQFVDEPSAATSSAAALEAGSADSTMPQHVRVRLNVGGTVFHTSLHTLMEGARHGGVVFQCLCVQILGPWANTDAAAAGGTAAGSLPAGVAWAQRCTLRALRLEQVGVRQGHPQSRRPPRLQPLLLQLSRRRLAGRQHAGRQNGGHHRARRKLAGRGFDRRHTAALGQRAVRGGCSSPGVWT
jgi:hypothetical protein